MKQGTQRVTKPAVRRLVMPPIVAAIHGALLRDARKVERDDWEKTAGVSNVERDRYVQATRDAATLVLQVWDRSKTRVARTKRAGAKSARAARSR